MEIIRFYKVFGRQFHFSIFFGLGFVKVFSIIKGSTNGHGGVTFQKIGQGIKTRPQNLYYCVFFHVRCVGV
jgi:hypothetical protein